MESLVSYDMTFGKWESIVKLSRTLLLLQESIDFPSCGSFYTFVAIFISPATFYWSLWKIPRTYQYYSRLAVATKSWQMDLHLGILKLLFWNTYKQLIGHQHVPRAFKWLCKSACQNKRKFFFWLILKDCLSTRALLKRRNMHLPN